MTGAATVSPRAPASGRAAPGGWRRWATALCLLACGLWLALGLASGAQAQKVRTIPALTGRVIDTAEVLTVAQQRQLDNRLAALERDKGSQIVVLLVPSTAPEDIFTYANRASNIYRIGRRSIGDGVLIVVAKEDRTVRIEVAKALEGAIPDLAAQQIIDSAITPRFRQGDFAGGLNQAVDQLAARIRGEPLPAPQPQADAAPRKPPSQRGPLDGIQWFDLAIFAFIGLPLVTGVLRRLLGRPVGALAGAGAMGGLALLFTSSLLLAGGAALVGLLFGLFSRTGTFGGSLPGVGGWSTGGGGVGGWSGGGGFSTGGGGGGGGFSSGGGGDFGGGGASGDW